ncbi:MAG: rod shape-determining protein MreC [Jatrophihabitans sp.]|nr:MAG: rod shape-determining protein MreC [Jatrophihabitans sp.]
MVLAVVALLLATFDLGGSGLRSAHGGVRGMLGALYRGTDAVVGPVRSFVAGIPTAGTNSATIARLRSQVEHLQHDLAGRQADATAQARLRTLQLAADSGGYRIVPARVIAFGPGQGFEWTVTLDAGTQSGIRDGQTVTDGAALVGRVLHVDGATCTVLLAADPGSGVGARDVRTGDIGTVTGAGTDGFTYVPLDPKAAVRAGDAVTTGPAGATTFVPGLTIGTVSAVRTGADGIISATVTPAAAPTRLDLVGVILAGGYDQPRAALSPTPLAGSR